MNTEGMAIGYIKARTAQGVSADLIKLEIKGRYSLSDNAADRLVSIHRRGRA